MDDLKIEHHDIEYAILETNRLADHLYDSCLEYFVTGLEHIGKGGHITEDQISAAFRMALKYTLEAVKRAARKLPEPEQRAPTASPPTPTSQAAYTRRQECRDFHKKHGELKRKSPQA